MKMRFFLNFVTPSGAVIWADRPCDPAMTGFDFWLQSIVSNQDDSVIFFFSTDSTDIASEDFS